MATSIRRLVRKLAGRPAPVPPGTAQRIQEREQHAAKQRLLRAANQTPEARWAGR